MKALGAILFLAACIVLVVAPLQKDASTPSDNTIARTASSAESDLLAGIGQFRASRIQAEIDDVDALCIDTGAAVGGSPETLELGRLTAVLKQSPLGAWLLEQTAFRRVLICQDRATEFSAYYRSQMRLVAVNAGIPEARKLVFLLHELAHVVQHPHYSNNRTYPPRDMLLLRRVREAAAEAIATRILWDLRQQGHEEPWQEKLKTHYKDIALAYEEAWQGTDPSLDQDMLATCAAFDRWFQVAWRRNLYDRMSLDHLSDVAKDRIGLVRPYRRLSDAFLRGIGWYGGANFLSYQSHRSLMAESYGGYLSRDNARRLYRFQRLTPGALAARRSFN